MAISSAPEMGIAARINTAAATPGECAVMFNIQ